MKSDHPLLRDVFAEGTPTGVREAMLRESLGVVRRRNRVRRVQKIAALMVAMACAVVFTWRNVPHHETASLTKAPEAKPHNLVGTRPFDASECITTHHFEAVDNSSIAPVQIVQTESNHYGLLDDAQLLSMLSPRPCMLVQVAPGSEKLVFVNPADAKDFHPD